MNENFINMYTELNRKYPDIYGRDLRIDAIDRKDRYDDDKLFDETILDKVILYYKQQTISIERYYENNWEIEDEDYIICRRMLSHRWYFADELQQQNLLKR